MTRRKRFYINGLIQSSVGLVLKSVQLFFSAYVARVVGAEGVGLNTLVMTVFAFALTFATSGVGLCVTRLVASEVARGEGKERETVTGAFVYSLAFGGAASVLLFSFAEPIAVSVLHYPFAAASLRVLSLSLLPVAFGGVIAGVFVAKRHIFASAAVQVLSQVIRVAVTATFILTLGGGAAERSVYALSLGTTVSEYASFFLLFITFIILEGGRGFSRRAALKPVVKGAMPLAVSAYIRSLLLSLEHNLIPKRLIDRGESVAEAMSDYGTLHGMALPLVLYPMSPLGSFAGLLIPEFAESGAMGDDGRSAKIASEAIGTTAAYATVCSVMIFVFSEPLGYILYSSYDAGRFIAFLAPVLPIMYIDHVTDAILKGIGEEVYSMWVNIIDAFLSILLVYVLIPVMGIMGYALVIVGMEAFNFTLSFIRLRRRIKFHFSIIKSLVVPLFSSLLAATLFYAAFPLGIGTSPLWLALGIVFSLSATVAGGTLLRSVIIKRTR